MSSETSPPSMEEYAKKLRYGVIDFLLQQRRRPTIHDLVDNPSIGLNDDNEAARTILGRLRRGQERHLEHYGSQEPPAAPIPMAQPASQVPASPAPNLVTSNGRTWSANCAWCAFGVAAMIEPDSATVQISTESGQTISMTVADGEIKNDDILQGYSCIFSASPSGWWHHLQFDCSSIRICASGEEAAQSRETDGLPEVSEVDIVTLNQLLKLSKAWHQDKEKYEYQWWLDTTEDELLDNQSLSHEYQQDMEAYQEDCFEEIGLVSPFWSS